jgi:tetratricopeptide (TPR) repeat protein
LALRKALAAERGDLFRSFSARMAARFAPAPTPAARIEWIYHRLAYASDDAASELEKLNRDWSSAARPEDRQALAVALRELISSDLLHGRGLLWASLSVARTRADRGETAQLTEEGLKALRVMARELRDPRAESDAQCLLGDVLQTQGKLEAARAAFEECLAISQRLAQQDPSNTGWQRELAAAHSRVGDVLEAQGELETAQRAFNESLAIS